MTSASDDDGRMTPRFALAASLIYGALASGRPRPGDLVAVLTRLGEELGDDASQRSGRLLASRALAYVERTPVAKFLADAAPALSERQRLCILLNMLESTAADTVVDLRERELLFHMQHAFGVSKERFRPLLEAILIKDIRATFGGGGAPRGPDDRRHVAVA